MIEHALQNDLIELMRRFGDLGVFLSMFLESSFVPIPSEIIVAGAGAIGISMLSIVIYGSLGSTLGAMIGYCIGRYAAMPVILKFGKFIFIKAHHIEKAHEFAKKYGAAGVIAGRVLPIIPFKVFSIASGITRIPFVPFVVCTMIGVVPRMYFLALFGYALVKFTKMTVLISLVIAVGYAVYRLIRNIFVKNKVVV